MIDNIVPLIYDDEHPIYTDNGINFDILSHLETIGLIQFGEIAGFIRKGLPQKINLYYYGTKLSIEFQFLEDNQFDLGKVLLTQAGHQLAQICSPSPREGFLEYARQKWISLGYKVE